MVKILEILYRSDTKSLGFYCVDSFRMGFVVDSGAKIVELILGISITGIVSSVVFLFKWVDRLDLECHDLKRDINHVKNNYESVSRAVADIDKDAGQSVSNFESRARSVDRRFAALESRLSEGEEKSLSILGGRGPE